jgi:hypothetical protein
MVEGQHRKTHDSSTSSLAILPAESSDSKQDEWEKGMMILALENNFLHSCNLFSYMP